MSPGCILIECRSPEALGGGADGGVGGGLLGHSRAVLLVDSPAVSREVRSLEEEEEDPDSDSDGGRQPRCDPVIRGAGGDRRSLLPRGVGLGAPVSPNLALQQNAVLRDLGSWLEFCHGRAAQHRQRSAAKHGGINDLALLSDPCDPLAAQTSSEGKEGSANLLPSPPQHDGSKESDPQNEAIGTIVQHDDRFTVKDHDQQMLATAVQVLRRRRRRC